MIKRGVRTQRWKDVLDYSTLPIVCDLCNSTEKVKEGEIPITRCNIVESVIVGSTYWRLCQTCHDEGWTPDTESFYSRIKYFNAKGSCPVAIKMV